MDMAARLDEARRAMAARVTAICPIDVWIEEAISVLEILYPRDVDQKCPVHEANVGNRKIHGTQVSQGRTSINTARVAKGVLFKPLASNP